MKTFKQTMLRIFFVFELIVFIGVYLFGPGGIKTMRALEQENDELNKQISVLQSEVVVCDKRIEEWESSVFYKEQIAREQLQMARDGEEVYYLKKQND